MADGAVLSKANVKAIRMAGHIGASIISCAGNVPLRWRPVLSVGAAMM